MYGIVSDETGLIHLLSAVIALIAGTLVLCLKKGTACHKNIGYVYVGSMLAVNVTAFLIYRLFGGFVFFHIAALLSLCTLGDHPPARFGSVCCPGQTPLSQGG